MNRFEFHKLFKCPGTVILPVIHVIDLAQTVRNVRIAVTEGAQGVLLINHDYEYQRMLPIVADVRSQFPGLWMGLNFLAVTGLEAFSILGQLHEDGTLIDAYWADDACIDEHASPDTQTQALAIDAARKKSGWRGLYFGGSAFKKQRPVAQSDYAKAAAAATAFMDVVTTSGVATGKAIDTAKVDAFRAGCGDSALAIASGVTPENAHHYVGKVDCIVVATGINEEGDFYNLNPVKLRALLSIARSAGAGAEGVRPADDNRWYLPVMAPNIKGDKFAWLDPSTMYINARTFHALVDDLVAPFAGAEVDVVAGFDAMGFVLGTALATRLGKGFLTIRKSGKLPVETDSVEFVNYSGRTQRLEMRMPAFASGTRVLLVDQWVETGGTMGAGIELVERQGGVVAGIAAVCIEESQGGRALRAQHKCSTAILSGSEWQHQCNQQAMVHFETFDTSSYFPIRADAPGD